MTERVRLTIDGVVQGVGFRPFVYRLATALQVAGWVNNTPQGVTIEAEAESERLHTFIEQLQSEKPVHALITCIDIQPLALCGERDFHIRASELQGKSSTQIVPDLATCADCVRELFEPNDRRYLYPFITCTYCGPRFTIIEGLPYDRPNTTMRGFPLCPDCQAEYDNPLDRRFHAQPIACPHCGPQLALWDRQGQTLSVRHDALLRVADAIRDGQIVALKGLGGFHLIVDARNAEAVNCLRERKHRAAKPFAVMYPSLATVRQACEVSQIEAHALTSAAAPIVLLRATSNNLAPSIAPDNPNLGVMLPYTPLHHLLMHELGFPIVATSGNPPGEPICIDEYGALKGLGAIADVFLVHNRPIANHADDSIVRVMAGEPVVLRRARGYVPQRIVCAEPLPNVAATGAHLKNAVAVSDGHAIHLSQYIGDMDSPAAVARCEHILENLQTVYSVHPEVIAHDLHPDYHSTHIAEKRAQMTGAPSVAVQHHYAHVLACMAENNLRAPVLGVAWDGTGYGTDGTIWGGEFLQIDERSFRRVANLLPFPLIGGDRAAREPRRSALGLLWRVYGSLPDALPTVQAFTTAELKVLKSALRNSQSNAVVYMSSAGRLFDALASITGLLQISSFEGQATMLLEFAAAGIATGERYPFHITSNVDEGGIARYILDYRPMLERVVNDQLRGVSPAQIAAKTHQTFVRMIVTVAEQVGISQIALTGGCFQNKRLLEGAIDALRSAGFQVFWQRELPPNDGSIAVGQVLGAIRARNSEKVR